MAIQTLQQPGLISFSRNSIVFQFKTDARYAVRGFTYIGRLTFDYNAPESYGFTLSYGDISQNFTVTQSPDDSGLQLPSYWNGDTLADYTQELADALNGNFYLSGDFVFEPAGDGANYWISVSARKAGTIYNLSVSNSAYIGLQTSRYGTAPVLNPNFKLLCELWIQKTATSEPYKVSDPFLEVDDDGVATLDISGQLTDVMLADGYERPVFTDPIALVNLQTVVRYFLRYAEVYGDSQVVRRISTTGTFFALLGGISKEKLAEFNFPGSFIAGDKLRFLKQEPLEKYLLPEQPEFLSVVLFNGDHQGLQLKFTVHFDDDSTATIYKYAMGTQGQFTKLTYPVGFVQNALNLVKADHAVIKYDVVLVNGAGDEVSETKTYWIDYSFLPYARMFVYLSSWGTYDTLVSYGKGSSQYDILNNTAEINTDRGFVLAEGERINYATSLNNKETIASGYMEKAQIRIFKDIALSRDILLYRKKRTYAVAFASKSVKEFKDGENMHAISFEIGFRYDEELFTLDDRDDQDTPLFLPLRMVQSGPAAPLPDGSLDYRYYLKSETLTTGQINDLIKAVRDSLDTLGIKEAKDIQDLLLKLQGKADTLHDHDERYILKADLQDLIIQMQDVIDNGSALAEDITFDIQVGAVNQGVTLTKGTNLTEVIKAIAFKVYYPILNLPKFSLSHQEPAQIEVGTVLTVDLVFNFDRGKIQATWPGGVDMPIVGEATGYRFWNADESGFQLVGGNTYQKQNYVALPGANSFKADVIYNAGPQPKDSKGNNFGGAMPAGISDKVSTSFTGLYKHFWSAVAVNPATAAEGRLGNSAWSTANTFTVSTGITLTRWAVLIAPGKKVAKVMDTTTNNDITTEYQLLDSNFSVNDAGGNLVFGYKLYVKSQSGTYDSSHDHVFTLNNN
ncbi:hypothetical protein KHS38_12170 [Mucilaginibacter sp. Bleaf8]|uniref:hypothetical protein n=1 Tax=Mucilaginibacter sp. Bleaf8 TaxID=2834430 RepID=UPI001BCD3627|nr:hypothetical protein [Mucilaginibacter sp. Bleaf8]MBS7565161.1 hypothetical protein [Mucilaginibacter sp. Bleaf8]